MPRHGPLIPWCLAAWMAVCLSLSASTCPAAWISEVSPVARSVLADDGVSTRVIQPYIEISGLSGGEAATMQVLVADAQVRGGSYYGLVMQAFLVPGGSLVGGSGVALIHQPVPAGQVPGPSVGAAAVLGMSGNSLLGFTSGGAGVGYGNYARTVILLRRPIALPGAGSTLFLRDAWNAGAWTAGDVIDAVNFKYASQTRDFGTLAGAFPGITGVGPESKLVLPGDGGGPTGVLVRPNSVASAMDEYYVGSPDAMSMLRGEFGVYRMNPGLANEPVTHAPEPACSAVLLWWAVLARRGVGRRGG